MPVGGGYGGPMRGDGLVPVARASSIARNML